MNRAARLIPDFKLAWREGALISALDNSGILFQFPDSSLHVEDLADQNIDVGEIIPEFRLPVLRQEARSKRARLLTESDWTQLPDVPAEIRAAWADYRQALRDLPAQGDNALDWIWPEEPNI